MESTGDKTLHWAVTRIGQVILFWGALEALLQVLDLLTNSDLLLTLRLSLTPALGFLADPWVALLLVGVGFWVIWKSHQPPKVRKPLLTLGQPELEPEPDTPDFSLLRSAGLIMPLFLALVCGMAFGGFEWSSPNHGQVSRRAGTTSARILSGAVHRRQPARGAGPDLSAPSDQPVYDRDSETLASLAPRLTPDFDENGAPSTASVVPGDAFLAQCPADPRAAARAFAYNGARKLLKAGGTPRPGDSPERKVFDDIEEAHRTQNWWLLASLSESAIRQTPQWLTPYLFAGEAYVNLGKIDRAIPLLEYVNTYGEGNPDYAFATHQATRLRQSIKQRYGR